MNTVAERWRQQWAEYEAWAATKSTRDSRDFTSILRDLGLLYSMAPEHLRRTDPDPDKEGVQAYHRALAAHERYRQRS